MTWDRVVVVGLDGFDPSIVETMVAGGELPHLERMARTGAYRRLATTLPAQTPVAWSSFAVGANPGAHGIFDFLGRDPRTYRPEVALYRYEQPSRFLPPRAVNLREGVPLWRRLHDGGIESTVLRHPCTYPPDARAGRMLSGVGVPDIRGGFGSTSWIARSDPGPAAEGEHLRPVAYDERGGARFSILGPRAPGGGDASVEIELQVDVAARRITLSRDGSGSLELEEGRWSDWLHLSFRIGRLQRVRGLVRFHLVSADPLRLFASPVHFDPEMPLFPISEPRDYAAELRRALGPFHTLGMAEEHRGLEHGRISEEAFLEQCRDVLAERRAMMHYELERLDRGLLYCLFDTPDRIQHMFWRFREPDHPAHAGGVPSGELARVIEDHYRACDAIVGEASAYAGDDTLLLVASDHGFASFRRALHLNTWLHREGYLALRHGVGAGDEAGDLLSSVDWGRTRAYAVGLAGIFLNLRGREADGIVEASEAEPLKAELSSRLSGLPDPERGATAVRRVLRREDAYAGPFVERAPDLLVSCAPGYRVSAQSALGGVPRVILEDNRGRWSGDHVVDPAAVPGVLFSNRSLREGTPSLVDLAPTVLEALGAPGGASMEGRSLLP